MEVLLSTILGEVVSEGYSFGKEKLEEKNFFNKLNYTIRDFNEEFNGTELDTKTFSDFLNYKPVLLEYYKEYYLHAGNLNDDEEKLNNIIDLAIAEINKKRQEQGIVLFDERHLLSDYFTKLKENLRNQRMVYLGRKYLLFGSHLREGIHEDIKFLLKSEREGFIGEIESLNKQNVSEKNLTKVGVRTHLSGTEKQLENSIEYLDLSAYFPTGKEYIDNEPFWDDQIKPKIEKFIDKIETEVEYAISIDTVQSVAFTLGYYANAKSNKILYPVQNGVPWVYSRDIRVGDKELKHSLDENDTENQELLVTIDLMNRNTGENIQDFYHNKNYDLLKIYPEVPDERYVLNGNHCIKLVYEVNNILQTLPVRMKKKKWKFAITAPNSFMFLLGRHADQYGKIQLLHFVGNKFKYINSITLG